MICVCETAVVVSFLLAIYVLQSSQDKLARYCPFLGEKFGPFSISANRIGSGSNQPSTQLASTYMDMVLNQLFGSYQNGWVQVLGILFRELDWICTNHPTPTCFNCLTRMQGWLDAGGLAFCQLNLSRAVADSQFG